MTDYNDGKWHGWNGGECPVRPQSIVECAYSDRRRSITAAAESFAWDGEIYECGGTDRPAAFRVVKEHKEPREFWVHPNKYQPEGFQVVHRNYPGAIHVREVLE